MGEALDPGFVEIERILGLEGRGRGQPIRMELNQIILGPGVGMHLCLLDLPGREL